MNIESHILSKLNMNVYNQGYLQSLKDLKSALPDQGKKIIVLTEDKLDELIDIFVETNFGGDNG